MTGKEQRAIELSSRFIIDDPAMTEQIWRSWLPQKMTSLSNEQLGIVRLKSKDRGIDPETMFLLHSNCGITLSQVESCGYSVSNVSGYAHLLHGLRLMTLTVEMWKKDLVVGLITLKELCDDGYGDIAEKLRDALIQEWLDGKIDLPPGLNTEQWLCERGL